MVNWSCCAASDVFDSDIFVSDLDSEIIGLIVPPVVVLDVRLLLPLGLLLLVAKNRFGDREPVIVRLVFVSVNGFVAAVSAVVPAAAVTAETYDDLLIESQLKLSFFMLGTFKSPESLKLARSFVDRLISGADEQLHLLLDFRTSPI